MQNVELDRKEGGKAKGDCEHIGLCGVKGFAVRLRAKA